MKIVFTKKFKKSYSKLDKKIKGKFNDRLEIFVHDEFDSVLNNHSLKGRYKDLRSINITGDLRALYHKKSENEIVIICFIDIGAHSELY